MSFSRVIHLTTSTERSQISHLSSGGSSESTYNDVPGTCLTQSVVLTQYGWNRITQGVYIGPDIWKQLHFTLRPRCMPLRSPELSHLDYFLWGAWKVLWTSVNLEMDLVAGISTAGAAICEMPGIFENVPWLDDVTLASTPMGAVSNISCDECKWYILLFCYEIKRFTLTSALWPYCITVSLYYLRVTFPPTLSCIIMVTW